MELRPTDLFKLGQQTLAALTDELTELGVCPEPGLELRRGAGLLCHYDLNDGHIYLSIPDPNRPRGKFQLLLMRSVMNLRSDEELLRLLAIFIPWFVAHELAHHLRHRYGLYGPNLWGEEWVANRFAMIYVGRRLTPAQKQNVLACLAQAMRGLPAEWEAPCADAVRDPIRYLVTHMRRFYCDLLTGQTESLREFAQAHLTSQDRPLPTTQARRWISTRQCDVPQVQERR